jgi:hypothetical protein
MKTNRPTASRLIARAAFLAAAAVALAIGAAGCATSSGSCVDYAAPLPLTTRVTKADLVAVTSFTDTGRTIQLNAIYPVHEAHVQTVLHGRKPVGKILVTVVPGDCVTTGQTADYADGDPLATKTAKVLLLSGTKSHGVYSLAPWDVISKTQYDRETHRSTPRSLDRPPTADQLPTSTSQNPAFETGSSEEIRQRPVALRTRANGPVGRDETNIRFDRRTTS